MPDHRPARDRRTTGPPAPRSTAPFVEGTSISFELDAADRRRHGGPDREDNRAHAVAGGRGRRRRARLRLRDAPPRPARPTTGRSRRRSTSTAAFAGLGIGRVAMTGLARRAPAPGLPPRRRRDHAAQPGVDRAAPRARVRADRPVRRDRLEAGRWHGVEWFGLELGPRDEAPAPIRPLAEAIAEWEAAPGLTTGLSATRRSAASACGNQRQPGGRTRRHRPHVVVSQALIARSRGPHASPYSSRRVGGSSPIAGTSSQS